MSIIEHINNETFIEHGTPGEEGHWRVLYIKWTDGTDTEPGLTIEEVLDALLEQISHVFPDRHAPGVLLDMLLAEKYGINPDPQEYPTEVHLAAAAQDIEPAYEPAGQPITDIEGNVIGVQFPPPVS